MATIILEKNKNQFLSCLILIRFIILELNSFIDFFVVAVVMLHLHIDALRGKKQ